MNKDMVLKLMKKYCDKRSEYFYYKGSAAEYISINYENDVEEYFIEAADELLINLIWSLNTNIKKIFIESCLNVSMFSYDIDRSILTDEQINKIDKIDTVSELLDFILEEGKKTYEVN